MDNHIKQALTEIDHGSGGEKDSMCAEDKQRDACCHVNSCNLKLLKITFLCFKNHMVSPFWFTKSLLSVLLHLFQFAKHYLLFGVRKQASKSK